MNHKKHNQIDYVEFTAPDLEKTKMFYTPAFGWTFVDYGPDYIAFNEDSGGFARSLANTSSKNPLVIIYSETLEETKEKVIKAGGMIVKDIYEFPGGKRFHFTDPAGNELAVWSDK